MEYKAELDKAMRRKRTYEDNTFKAYALLWERCAKAMQNKLESRTDYDSLVHKDPIALLRAIKEHSFLSYRMHSDQFSRLNKRTEKTYKTTRDGLKRLRKYWNPMWEDR
jgi:hypothetical protein